MPDNTGVDIDLMTEIAKALGVDVEFIAYKGSDFDGTFDGLNDAAYDCVTAGPTVTPERETKAQFVPPYLISGQSLAVDTTRLPHVRSIDDLAGARRRGTPARGQREGPRPDQLAAAGKLRVEHWQASLEELGRLADPPMTKDAVAGRIRRLLSMADRKAKQENIPDTESAVTPDLLEDA